MTLIDFSYFKKVDIRIGTIINIKQNSNLNNRAYILEIDFGKEIGIKKSSAQLTTNYNIEDLIDKQIAAVVNFPSKQIGNMMSEVLVLAFPNENNDPILITADRKIKNGGKLYRNYSGKLLVVCNPPSIDSDNFISPP